MSSVSQAGCSITIPAHKSDSECGKIKVEWTKYYRSRTGSYYVVKIKDQTQDPADVLLCVTDRFYSDNFNEDLTRNLAGVKGEYSKCI